MSTRKSDQTRDAKPGTSTRETAGHSPLILTDAGSSEATDEAVSLMGVN